MLAMQTSDFSYDLPDEKIAYHPPIARGNSKLLVLHRKSGHVEHRKYRDLLDYLEAGDTLILNNTKVIRARLLPTNRQGQIRELLLLERHSDAPTTAQRCLYRGKLRVNELLKLGNAEVRIVKILDGGIAEVESTEDFQKLADKYGEMPLPPYIKRSATKDDVQRYQTIFAKNTGSVAAPTASLNFTNNLQQQLSLKGVNVVFLTLHVGLGTFLPIRVSELIEHKMHSEYFEIPTETIETINSTRASGNRVFALGTTVARTLEYAHESILKNNGPVSGEADIFIYPGYKFQMVDGLITNFHAPGSTVLMLAAAFAGWDNLKAAYQDALNSDYQFLSYGDSMLIV